MPEFLSGLLNFGAEGAPAGGRFRFAEPWPGLVILLVVTGLLWWFHRLYQTERARASRRYRWVLTGLRSGAALCVVFMLLHPVSVFEETQEKDAYVVVLIDDSLSMSLKDKYEDGERSGRLLKLYASGRGERHGRRVDEGGEEPAGPSALRLDERPRAELVNRILAHPELSVLARLRQRCRLRLYTFSTGIRPVSVGGDDGEVPGQEWGSALGGARSGGGAGETFVVPQGQATSLGDAILLAADEFRGQRLAGIIVITDGQSNSGRDPQQAVEEIALRGDTPFPVFTVGVGSPRPPKDVEVLQVLASDAVFANDQVIFSAMLKAKGFEGQEVPVQLRKDGHMVAESRVRFLSRDDAQEVKLNHRPTETGQFTYEVLVPPQPGENLTGNNAQTHLLRVVDSRVRVLFVSDQPSWEYRYLKNALVRDHSIEVSCLLQSADPDFVQEGTHPIRRFPSGKEELYRFDVILFSDADYGSFSEEQMDALVGFVEDLGGGVFFSAGFGHQLDGLRGTVLEKLLPVSPALDGSGLRVPVTEPFTPRLTLDGLQHPILRLEADSDQNRMRWEQIPAWFWYVPVRAPKPGALTLMTHPHHRSESGDAVLLAAQIYGAGRTIFCASNSTWRWRLAHGDTFFYRFWGQAIRFLSTGRLLGSNRRLNLVTDRSSYQVGDRVVVTARLVDEFYRPVERPELLAILRDEKGHTESLRLKPVPRQPGTYQDGCHPSLPGRHEVSVEYEGGPAPATRGFTVLLPSLEFDRPEMNEPLLRKLAEPCGGSFVYLEDIASLPDRIREVQESISIDRQKDLWDHPFLLGFLALLLIVEWILRKRRMMI